MSIAWRTVTCITLWAALAATAAAQAPAPSPSDTAPPHPTALSEAGEPRANTSSGEAPPPAAAGAPAGAAGPAAAAKASGGPRPAKTAAAPGAGAAPKSASNDRLDLGVATVTGDREQPKVMYVVPWKRSDIGDLSGKPMNSLLDEALAPVDREEFKREVIYYQAVQADASQNGASKTAAKGEK